jgi:hypothetical protein
MNIVAIGGGEIGRRKVLEDGTISFMATMPNAQVHMM